MVPFRSDIGAPSVGLLCSVATVDAKSIVACVQAIVLEIDQADSHEASPTRPRSGLFAMLHCPQGNSALQHWMST